MDWFVGSGLVARIREEVVASLIPGHENPRLHEGGAAE